MFLYIQKLGGTPGSVYMIECASAPAFVLWDLWNVSVKIDKSSSLRFQLSLKVKRWILKPVVKEHLVFSLMTVFRFRSREIWKIIRDYCFVFHLFLETEFYNWQKRWEMGFGNMRLEMNTTKLVLKCFWDKYFLSCCSVCLYVVLEEVKCWWGIYRVRSHCSKSCYFFLKIMGNKIPS